MIGELATGVVVYRFCDGALHGLKPAIAGIQDAAIAKSKKMRFAVTITIAVSKAHDKHTRN